jgi:hypothetical protein
LLLCAKDLFVEAKVETPATGIRMAGARSLCVVGINHIVQRDYGA